MNKDDGGPAFPVTEFNNDSGEREVCGGMSLRDHFAGLALNGILSAPIEVQRAWVEVSAENGVRQQAAISGAAYEYADAMLQARKEKAP